jgi:AraC-like DNA-binding protein
VVAPFLEVAREAGVSWRPEWHRLGLHPGDDYRDHWLITRDAYLLVGDLAYRQGISSLGVRADAAGQGRNALDEAFREGIDRSGALLEALVTARALAHLQSRSLWIGFRLTPDELWVCHRGAAEAGMPGHDHVEVHRTLRVVDEVRRYAGAGWRPSFIGLAQAAPVVDDSFLAALRPDRVQVDLPFGVVAIPRALFERASDEAVGPGTQAASRAPWLGLLEAVLPSVIQASGPASVDAAAEMLGWSTRTLQRRLGEEGTSYRDVLAYARAREARRLLLLTDDPVHEVARQVGYTDASNFGRAFRRFWGLGPDALRSLERASAAAG